MDSGFVFLRACSRGFEGFRDMYDTYRGETLHYELRGGD